MKVEQYNRSLTRSPDEEPNASELTNALGGKWNALTGVGKARCPAHDDKSPSLDIENKDGRTVFICRANCENNDVIKALRRRGVWPEARPMNGVNGHAHAPRKQIIATYDYVDQLGILRLQVVRFAPKSFQQRRPDGNGGWHWNLEGVQPLIYRLPEVLEAIAAEQIVFIAEGEKDVDRLVQLGVTATCNAAGAGKWRCEHSEFLKGARVVILPDNDEAGRKHAQAVASSLNGVAVHVRTLELEGLPPKGDVSDWIDAGGTAEQLWALAERTRAGSTVVEIDLPDIEPWPILNSRAAHGIVGKIARLATADSEADPAAVIATTLAYAAAEFGRNQYTRIGDSTHHSRHFNAIVGQSSRARKGTSFGPVQRIFRRAEEIRLASSSTRPFPSGSTLKISYGPLSSGEGLINAVRDGEEKPHDGSDDYDKGVLDKRLLLVEEEFGSALRMFQRTGNSLSTTLRRVWDGNGTIAPITKSSPIKATDPHVNIVGHITSPELKELLKGSEIWNGFGNRFQWLMARRPKTVPIPKPMPDEAVDEIAAELARVILKAHAGPSRELVMSNAAQDHWVNIYAEITQDFPGILGAITSRQEAHARRLALTYAQLDGADRIEIDHLEAALAFTRYAFDSAAYLFGGAELDPIAQQIIEALRPGPKTQTEIQKLFSGHLPAEKLANALRGLQERGRVTLRVEQTGGRPRRTWEFVG